MFEAVRIKGFQCHAALEVGFSEGVTSITGDTDTGKSAIIRALVWLALNRPNGTGIINDKLDKAVVALKVDGHLVKRIRSKTTNLYKIGSEEFKAFGNEVPDEVQKLLGVSELNFQSQMDAPFWLSKSPAEVARALNSVVNLGIIDTSLSNAAGYVRKAKTHVEFLTEQRNTAKVKAQELEWVDSADEDFQNLVALEVEVVDLEKKVDELVTELNPTVSAFKEARATRRLADDAQAVADLGEKWDTARDSIARLEGLMDRILDLRRAVKARTIGDDLEVLERLDSERNKVALTFLDLDQALGEILYLRSEKNRLREEANQLEAKLHTMTKGKCPLCGKTHHHES